MLTRSIEIEPSGPGIGQKISRNAKRVCIALALVAVAMCTLDLMHIRSLANAAEFAQRGRQRIAELPLQLRDLIRSTVQASPVPHAVAMIPRGEFASVLRLTRKVAADALSLGETSPVAKLAATHTLDAIALAMAPPAEANVAPPAVPAKSEPAGLAAAQETPAIAAPAAPVAAVAAARAAEVAPPAVNDAAPPPVTASSEPASDQPAQPIAQTSTEAAAAPQVQPATLAFAELGVAEPDYPLPVSLSMSLPMSAAIPPDAVPLPRPAPGPPPPSPAELLHLEGKTYAKAERCLANAIYFEARGEPVSGQIAVAQVVMNRVFSGFYPNDVCAVIYQNANRHLACQFTFACDGKRKIINERGPWARANRIAKQTLDGKLYETKVGASTHYHAIYVHPVWVREMHKLARYGIHNFYRPIAWGNGSDEPIWSTAALAQARKK